MSLPNQLQPMLAVAAEPFNDPEFFFEVKWDGWRCLAYLDGKTRLQSRNLRDLTPTFPDLLEIHQNAEHSGVLLDGEIVTFWEGKPSFIRLHRRGLQRPGAAAITATPAVFIAFDLLYFKGEPLLERPLEERRYMLEQYVHPGAALQISETVVGQGRAFFEACRNMDLEGVVGKNRSSLYLPGKRSPQWKKSKVLRRSHFTICGYTTAQGKTQLNAVALAAPTDDVWEFYGLAGSGIDAATAATLLDLLTPLQISEPPPFIPRGTKIPRIHWVKPQLVVEIEFLEITADLKLRHPVWRGLRPNQTPADCLVT